MDTTMPPPITKLDQIKGPVPLQKLRQILADRTDQMMACAEKNSSLIFPISRLLESSGEAFESDSGSVYQQPVIEKVHAALASVAESESWKDDENVQRSLTTCLHLLCLFNKKMDGPSSSLWSALASVMVGVAEKVAGSWDSGKALPAFLPLILIFLDQLEAGSLAARCAAFVDGAEWRYLETSGQKRWAKFVAAAQKQIEKAWAAGRPSVSYSIQNRPYTLDFTTMTQVNTESHVSRAVIRIPKEPEVDAWRAKDAAQVAREVADMDQPSSALGREKEERLVRLCTRLLALHDSLDAHSLEAVLRLSLRLTKEPSLAALFQQEGGLRRLVSLPAALSFPGVASLIALLSRQVLEQEETMEKVMERVIRVAATANANSLELHSLLRTLAPVAARRPKLFFSLIMGLLEPNIPSTAPNDTSATLKAHLQKDWLQVKAHGAHPAKAPLTQQMKDVADLLLEQIAAADPDAPTPASATGDDKEPPTDAKSSARILTKSGALRLLAELCRSFASLAVHVATKSNVKDAESGNELPALEYIFREFLDSTPADDRTAALQTLVETLAGLNQALEVQTSLVLELKAALARAVATPEGPERHRRIAAVVRLISLSKEHCSDVVPPHVPADGAAPQTTALQRNAILRLFLKKKLIQDLARVPLEVNLQQPGAVQTINAVLKPLEELCRLVNHTPGAQSKAGEAAHIGVRAAAMAQAQAELRVAPAMPPPTEASVTVMANSGGASEAEVAAEADSSPSSHSSDSDSDSEEEEEEARAMDAEEDGDDADDGDEGEELNSEDEEVEEEEPMDMAPTVPLADGPNDMGSENSSEYEDMGAEAEEDDDAAWDAELMDEEAVDPADVEWLDAQHMEDTGLMTMGAIEDALQHLVQREIQQLPSGANARVTIAEPVQSRHPLLRAEAGSPDRPDMAMDIGADGGAVGGHIARQGAFRNRHPVSGVRLGRFDHRFLAQPGAAHQRYRSHFASSRSWRLLEDMMGEMGDVAEAAGRPGTPVPSCMHRWVELERILDSAGAMHSLIFRIAAPLIATCRQALSKKIAEKEEEEAKKKKEDEEKATKEAEEKKAADEAKAKEEAAKKPAETPTVTEEATPEPVPEAAVATPIPTAEEVPVYAAETTPTPPEEQPAVEIPAPAEIQATAAVPVEEEAAAAPTDADNVALLAEHASQVANFRHMLGELDVPLGVDPAFLAALPESMRAEVIEDHHRQTRIQAISQQHNQAAAANPQSAEAPAPINPEFLQALPAELQEELLRQQQQAAAAAAAAAAAPPPGEDEPVDQTAFLESLPPNLRRQVLADMEDSQLTSLPARFQEEARTLRRQLETQSLARLAVQAEMGDFMGNVDLGGAMNLTGGLGFRIRQRQARADRVTAVRDPRNGGGMTAEAAAQSLHLPRGLQLVDRASLAALIVLNLAPKKPAIAGTASTDPDQSTELNRARLQKVLKYLCSHPGTRDWCIASHLALLERALEPDAVVAKDGGREETDAKSSLNTSDDGILISTQEQSMSWLDSLQLFQHSGKKALQMKDKTEMSRLVLDSLVNIAKTFPAQFLPLSLRQKEADSVETPEAKPGRKDSLPIPDIFTALAQLESRGSDETGRRSGSFKGCRAMGGFSVTEAGVPRKLDESPLGRLMAQLANPSIKAEGVLPRLLRLLTSLLVVIPHHSISQIGELEGRLEDVVGVMAQSGRSEDDEGRQYLLECVRVFQKPIKRLIVKAVADSAQTLGTTLTSQLRDFRDAMSELGEDADAGAEAAAEPSGSIVVRSNARLGGAEAVISAAATDRAASSSVCPQLQVPAVAPLTAKSSAQTRLLDLLNTLLTLRQSIDALDKAVSDAAASEALKAEAEKNKAESEKKKDDGGEEKKPESVLVETPQPKEKAAEEEEQIEAMELNKIFCLDDLWDVLSDCLDLLAKASDPHAVLVLQPAAEAFFLVHAPTKKSTEAAAMVEVPPSPEPTPMDASPPLPPSTTTTALVAFAEKHRKIVNQILRQAGVPLKDGPFAALIEHPNHLDFDIKERYFRKELGRAERRQRRREDVALRIRRDQVFQDSFRELFRLNSEDWKSRFYIIFEGEEGQDAGGLLREWFLLISQSIFNPNYGLFKIASGDGVTYMINPASYVNHDHLDYFRFVGRLIAKAILDNKFVTCYFTRAFYKHILAKPVKPGDLESEDPEHFKSLKYLLEHSIAELGMDLHFSIEVEEFGKMEERELKPGGKTMPVTDENKLEYMQLVCQTKMTGSIRQQLDKFLSGFYDLIPRKLISIFNEQELELLIAGLPEINVEDLEANTEYHRYTRTSPQIVWLWKALRDFQQEDQAKFLQFVTGTSKVPLRGFAHLEGMNGTQKFSIHRDDRQLHGLRLPCAHTCFNQLDLPVYESYEQLHKALLTAVQECHQGFGFA